MAREGKGVILGDKQQTAHSTLREFNRGSPIHPSRAHSPVNYRTALSRYYINRSSVHLSSTPYSNDFTLSPCLRTPETEAILHLFLSRDRINMVADALVHLPALAHWLRFVATTGT